MSLFGDITDRLFSTIWDRIKTALGPFGKAIDLITNFFHSFKEAYDTGNALTQEIISEINEWRNFREAVPVRTGVVNLRSAIDSTQDLLDQIKAAWEAIVDLAKLIREKVTGAGENPTDEAKEAMDDIEGSGFKGLFEKFPKLAKGFEKLLGFLAIAVDTLTAIRDGINDLKAVVDAIKGIREEIETGSTIFLSQKNPRRTERLESGGSIRIRVGNLHS